MVKTWKRKEFLFSVERQNPAFKIKRNTLPGFTPSLPRHVCISLFMDDRVAKEIDAPLSLCPPLLSFADVSLQLYSLFFDFFSFVNLFRLFQPEVDLIYLKFPRSQISFVFFLNENLLVISLLCAAQITAGNQVILSFLQPWDDTTQDLALVPKLANERETLCTNFSKCGAANLVLFNTPCFANEIQGKAQKWIK